jgi:hypothetical protein
LNAKLNDADDEEVMVMIMSNEPINIKEKLKLHPKSTNTFDEQKLIISIKIGMNRVM